MDDGAPRHYRKRRVFPDAPPPVETTTPAPPFDLADFERRARAQWERDRQARIRRGACPRCAERLCPRVGGRDRECVTLADLAVPR